MKYDNGFYFVGMIFALFAFIRAFTEIVYYFVMNKNDIINGFHFTDLPHSILLA